MTQFEGLQPHELAEQLATVDYQVVSGEVVSERLADLIDRSQVVWRELAAGQFEQNEHGHVRITIQDWTGDYQTPFGDHVDALGVEHRDTYGRRTSLGRIARRDYDTATATVSAGEGNFEPLLPSDERWNAVVGVAERAIMQCLQERQMGEQ